MSKINQTVQERLERINNRKKVIGSQQDRVLKNYSPNFLQIFNFFLKLYRADILTFSGGIVTISRNSLGSNQQHEAFKNIADAWVIPDSKGSDGLFSIREFENGRFKRNGKEPVKIQTRHPNIVRAFIQAKKSWGLLVKEWSEGIGKGLFTKAEILDVFTDVGIGIPYPRPEKPSYWGYISEQPMLRNIARNPETEYLIATAYNLVQLEDEADNYSGYRGLYDEFIYGFKLFMPKPFYTELSNAIWNERFRCEEDLMGSFLLDSYVKRREIPKPD